MTQYHEGQEVEVYDYRPGGWCKARIVGRGKVPHTYRVAFPDDTRSLFLEHDIRLSKQQAEQELIENGHRFIKNMSK